MILERQRRNPAQMAELLTAIQNILAGEQHPITMRHLFYRLVGLGMISKTENAYRSVLVRFKGEAQGR